MSSEDYGNHLLEVEDFLQKLSLVEADIAAQSDRVTTINKTAEEFLTKVVDSDSDGMCYLICFKKTYRNIYAKNIP